MKKGAAFRGLIFVLLLILLLGGVNRIVTIGTGLEDYRNYQLIAGFYEERPNSLDAVYIGGSNTLSSWIAPLAWEHYGIAVWPFSCDMQPIEAARYLIEEARKSQPDALYIVPINTFTYDLSNKTITHYLTDYFPASLTKLRMVKELADLGGLSAGECLEFIFPFIQYHARWNELIQKDFHYEINGLKGGMVYGTFFKTVSDVSSSLRATTRRLPLSDSKQAVFEDLLDYCDREHINVLFVTSPQIHSDESWVAQINTINDLIESHGYPVVNMLEHLDEIGLDLTQDYYNENHTNVHGAVKTTDYLAKYLVENYKFEDKRGNAEYSDWDASYDKYVDVIAPYALDIEYTNADRDYSLVVPKLSNVSVNGTTLTLKWAVSDGADGYQIYRKAGESGWIFLAEVESDTLSYRDENCKVGETYTYTVIPYRRSGNTTAWGKYDFTGVSATATLAAPQLEVVFTEENSPVLIWEGVRGANGYTVYRRVAGKGWVMLEDVGLETTYTDRNTLINMPYEYRVRAYYMEDETSKWGSYSSGRLWLPELQGPQITAAVDGDRVVLTWPAVEGITGYTVARKTIGGDWAQLAEPLDASCQRFEDLTTQAGVPYLYRVTAYLKYGGDTYEFSTETTEWLSASAAELPLNAPKILFAEPVGENIQLLWEPQEYASAYRIYRRIEGADTWTVVKQSVTGNTYSDKPLEPGLYTYVIQALHTENGCTYYGEFQNDAACSAIPFEQLDGTEYGG